ncbi:MAG: hypothetical protein JW776_11710 [Candidatus Lokiarchaeota archaeon]|nr:hypothetical protein [Candidatus Lokiarchaeota archaeon]
MNKTKKAGIAFGVLFLITVAGIVLASGFQSSWGSVDVSIVKINTPNGYTLTGKLYVPEGVDSSNPAPGVLAIHGYNNDKDVQRPHSIELSKRGIVVLAIDVLNHGDSDYANTSTGSGNSAIPYEAMDYLKSLDFVDSSKIACTGHSMGAYYTLYIALANPDLEAIAPIAFAPITSFYPTLRAFNPDLDILQVSSWGEEFGRAYNETIEAFMERCLNSIAAFTGETAQWDYTYGNFTDGATRFELLKKTHPGQTHSRKSTAAITAFFLQSLMDYTEEDAFASANKNNMVYWLADLFGVVAMAGLLFSIIPLAILLMQTHLFGEVSQPMPKYKETYAPKLWVWWVFGIVNATIGTLTYIFNTEYSNDGPRNGDWVFDGTMIKNFAPNIWRSGIANDFLSFFVVNAGVMILIVLFWYFVIYRKKRVGFYDLGANYSMPTDEFEGEKPHGWRIFGKTIFLAFILFSYMYVITAVAQHLGNVEIRGPWSAFKVMTPERAVTFWYYFPGVLLFWIFNAGIWMFGMMRQKELKTEAGTIIVWWLKICVVMLTGLVLLNVISYVPMYLGLTGPYLNKLSFAPMNLLQLWSFIPYAAGFYLVAIFFFRKTGKIWLGTLMCSAITTWMMVTGYIMW